MSTETPVDVCHSQDEDVLRKMWQETEDFGKKKEIRSHMYKLREERLRDFYSKNDSGTDIQISQNKGTPNDTIMKEGNGPNHAQSLIDHSFLSMKSKEIRDSESPTSDIHHFRSTGNNGNGNRGWEIVTKNEVSDDGKRHASTKVATTSGSERIDKGVANYAAKCEQMSSQYEDGDANNFIKSNTSASKSVLSQEARGGDENNSFHSYSTSSNSSSKTVSQHYSGTEPRALPDSNDSNVVRKIYTTDVPPELKRSPNYIDGNTTVTTETRTLPDGTKVTTTRYETKGVSKKIDHQKHNYEQKSTRVDDTRIHHTVKQTSDDFNQRNRYVPIDDVGTSTDTVTKTDVKNVNEKNVFKNKDTSSDNLDDIYVTKIIRETEHLPKEQKPSSTLNTENETIIRNSSSKTTSTKNICDNVNATIKTTKIVREEEYSPYKKQPESDFVPSKEPIHHFPATSVPSNRQPGDKTPGGYTPAPNTPGDDTPTNYKPQEPIPPQEILKKLSPKPPEHHTDNRIVVEKTYIVDKPPSSVTEKVTTMTTHSTYKTDYTSKRISVDISPTHDAFARSLRASPDRDVKRGSTRSLKSSTSSLRASISPEKRYPDNQHYDRASPDRKQCPSKPEPKEPTPTRKSPKKDTTYEINTNTITRRRKVDSVDQKQLSTRTKTKTSRSPSPTTSTSDIEYIKKSDITDVGEKTTTKTKKPIGTTSRPDTLDFNKQQPSRRTQPAPSPSSPSKNIPSHNKPLKRTDTYEERCKQILGISEPVPKEVGKREKSPDRSNRKTPTKEPKPLDRKTSKYTDQKDNEHYVTKTVTGHTTVTTKIDKKHVKESPDKTTRTPTSGRRGPSPDRLKPKEYLDDHDDKKPYSKSPSQPTKIPNAKGKSPTPDKFRPNQPTEDYDECNVTTVDRTQYIESHDKITKVPSSKGKSPSSDKLRPKESPEDYIPYREFPDKSAKTPSSKQKSPISDKFKPKETPEDYNKYPTTKTGKSPTDDDEYTPSVKDKRPKEFPEDNDNNTVSQPSAKSPGKITKTPNIGRRSPSPDKFRPKESTEYYDEYNVTTVDRTQYIESRDKITKVPSSKGKSPSSEKLRPKESPEDDDECNTNIDKKPYKEFPDKSAKTPSSKQKSPISDKFKPKETPEDYNKYPTTKVGKSPADDDEYAPTVKGKRPKEFPEDNDNDTVSQPSAKSPGKFTKTPNIGRRSPSPDKFRPKESTEYYDEYNVTTVGRTQYMESRDKITKVPSSKLRPKESPENDDECNIVDVDRVPYKESPDKTTKVPSSKGKGFSPDKFRPKESPEEDYDECNTKPYGESPDKSTKTPSSKQKSPIPDKFKQKETPEDYNKYPTTKVGKSPTDDDEYNPTIKGKRPKELPEDNDDITSPGKITKTLNIGRRSPSPEKLRPKESQEDTDKYQCIREVTVTGATTKTDKTQSQTSPNYMTEDIGTPHKVPSKHKSTKPKEDTVRPDHQRKELKPHDSDESYNIIKKTTEESVTTTVRQKPKDTREIPQPEGNYPTKPKGLKQPTDFTEEYQGVVTKTSSTSKKQPLQPHPKDCNEPIERDCSPADTLDKIEQTFEDVISTSSKPKHPIGNKKPGLVPQLIQKYIITDEQTVTETEDKPDKRWPEKQTEDTKKHKITTKTEINVSSHKTPDKSKKQPSEKVTPINKEGFSDKPRQISNKTSKVPICQPEDEDVDGSTNKVTDESYVTETRKTTYKHFPDTSKEKPKKTLKPKDVDDTHYSSSDTSDVDEPVDTDGPNRDKSQKPKTRPSNADESYSIHTKDARVISKLSKKPDEKLPSPYESEPNIINKQFTDDDDYQPTDVREDKTTVSQIVNKFNKEHINKSPKTPDRPEKRPTDGDKPRKPKPGSVFEETVDIITTETERRRNKVSSDYIEPDDNETKKKPAKSTQPQSFGVTVIDKCYLKEDTVDRKNVPKQQPRGQHPADEFPKNRRPSEYEVTDETEESSVTNIHHETKLFESLNARKDVTEIRVKPRDSKPRIQKPDDDLPVDYDDEPLTKPGSKVKRPTDYDMPDESDYCKGSTNSKDFTKTHSPQSSDNEYYTTDEVDKTQRLPKKPTSVTAKTTTTTSKTKQEGRPIIPDHVKRGSKPEEDKPKIKKPSIKDTESRRQETIISTVSNIDKTSKKPVNTNNRIPKTYKSVTDEITITKKVDAIDKRKTTNKPKSKSSRPVNDDIRDGDDYYEPTGERPDSRTEDVDEYFVTNEMVKTTTKTQRGSASPQKERPKHRRPADESPECETVEDDYGEKIPRRVKTIVTRVKPQKMSTSPERRPAPNKQRPNYESPGRRVTEDEYYETNETTDRRTVVTKTLTKKVPTRTQEHPGRPKNEPVRKTKNKSPERRELIVRKVNEPRFGEPPISKVPKTEYIDKYCSPKEKPRTRKPVNEVFTATKTYSTTDKATVHRAKQDIPSKKQPGTKTFTPNDRTPVRKVQEYPRYKTKPDDEEYTSEEDVQVQKPYTSSREPTLSPERVCKSPRDTDDFYTLNIKVYKTSMDTKSTKRFDETSDNEEVDEKKRSRQLKNPNKPKSDKMDTIYRTVEKHYINKPAKPSTRTRTKPDESPDRRSHIKPVQKVATRRVTNTTDTKQSKTKIKPVETRHVVTTTIKVVPKNKGQDKGKPLKPVQPKRNDHPATEEDSDIEECRVDGKDMEENRTYNRQLTHTISDGRPDSPTNKIKKQEKVITTKSIIINNDFENQRGVTVNLQRSTSSREATPDRSYVYLGSDNEDKGYPRYPDEICEPDDGYKGRIPTKLSDIPIIETEDLSSSLNKVDDTDECLLSVNEKVNKFVNEAVKLTKPQTPDYSRNKPDDRLNIRHDIPSRPKSPRLRKYQEFEDEETFTSVSKKVSHFIETAEKIKSQQKPTDHSPKQKRPEFTNVNETERSTSVSDKVKQFTITSRTSPDKKPVSLAKIDSPSQPRPKTDTDCVQIDSEDDTYTRAPSHPDREVSPRRVHKEAKHNDREVSPQRTPSSQLLNRETSPRRTSLPSNRNTPKEHIYEPDSTPKSSRKPSDSKTVLSTSSRLRSTESVRKAKEIFENITKKQQPEEKHFIKPQNEITTDLKSIRLVMDKINRPRTPSTDDNVPGYMRPLNRSPRPQTPRPRSQSPSDRSRSPSVEHHRKPDDPSLDHIPHYMWPLDRSQHDHEHAHEDHEPSPKSRESSPFNLRPQDKQHRPKTPTRKSSDAYDGVSHKINTAPHCKLTIVEIENILTTHEIEEIYDIEILDILLERATNYEQRRRIRSQIRIVKQLIIDDKLPTVLIKKTPKADKIKDDRSKPSKRVTNEETIYTYSERRRSSETKVSTETRVNRKTPEKTVFKTDLRRVEPITKKLTEEKPSWVTQRPLKKPGDAPKPKHSSTTTAKRNDYRSSPSKEPKPTDAITSSYGVGPTDENGSPLFGLRALRAQTTTGKTKMQGTVIKSHYYSENGHEPVGEVSVTKYSTDPDDFEGVVDETNGLVSVTTTQKFGTKGSPSYKAIGDREDYEEGVEEERISRKSSSTSVTRRGSVKQMSKKFIDNAVETSKNERQSFYPKAGLILRTSSFKKEKNRSSSRESSPDNEVSTTTTVRRTTTSGTTREGRSDTFLNNQTRVTSVQDVMTRMRNADNDVQEGDQVEDAEARKLLNKFIGSQVILSGMESCSSSPPSVTTTKRTTTTSTSTKGGGKPTVVTRTFTHPISEEDLDTIWDEQTLKLLLERSTDYEERRIIRKRLRDVMAEKEVCADVTNEESSGRVEETIEKSKTEGPVTTCQVTTRVTSQQMSKKPLSPFAKFRQLDKQNSSNTPPGTPRTPTGSTPLFKFTDPELSRQASTVKERLLQWCQMKTKEYENIQLDNFSSSWADGLAFCALIHHFLPDAFDYHVLTPQDRKHNFTLAFRIADEKADIVPLLDVEDMIATRKPDWKCVFTYVQTIYARFKNED